MRRGNWYHALGRVKQDPCLEPGEPASPEARLRLLLQSEKGMGRISSPSSGEENPQTGTPDRWPLLHVEHDLGQSRPRCWLWRSAARWLWATSATSLHSPHFRRKRVESHADEAGDV